MESCAPPEDVAGKGTTSREVYLADEVYFALREALSRLAREPFEKEGTDPETEVTLALGEIGNVWPESVLQ